MIANDKPLIDARSTVIDGSQGYVPPGDKSGGVAPTESAESMGNGVSIGDNSGGGDDMRTSLTTEGVVPRRISERRPSGGITGEKNNVSSYDDLIKELERRVRSYRPLSEDDLAKLRRKQRREGIVSGISDAARSIVNLISAHNYAPNMYNSSGSMSSKARERFEKAKAEREAEDDKYFNYALTLGNLRESADDKAYSRGRDALQDALRESADQRAQAKADRDAAMAELKMSEQEAAAEAQRIENEYADEFWRSRINKNNYRPARSSGGGGRSKGGGGSTWYAVDSSGETHSFTAKGEANARNVAGGKGWSLVNGTVTTERETKKGVGGTKVTKTTRSHETKVEKKKKNRLGL